MSFDSSGNHYLFFSFEKNSKKLLPLFDQLIQAGFPSPADDFMETPLDLNEHLITNEASTFFIKVQGDSMQGAGIFDGDLLIVDRSKEALSGNIIIAILNGEFTVKRLHIKQNSLTLDPENPNYSPIVVSKEDEFEIWGVVTFTIHKT